MRVATMGDILPDRIWEIYRVWAATHLGMMILLWGSLASCWRSAQSSGCECRTRLARVKGSAFL
ncbi:MULTISPECIES: hypothetical protein [unclassified Microcoleus]|uniref:hypothetical protein n=1 Tax=unclassified Microcoleus TaxID=2642155 RepID=UPI002FD60FA4